MSASKPDWHVVKKSKTHGHGIFAARKIPEGTNILEYKGNRIRHEEADEIHPTNPDDPFHTFFFSLSCGKVIDGGQKGNDAKWFNHSCGPNCEAQENQKGTKVYVVALRDIKKGEELTYDYGLVLDGRITKKRREEYQCLCGTPECRGTMLALKNKKARKTEKAAQSKGK